MAAGTEAGLVVGHVAFVGVGDEGEESEGDGGELHVDREYYACGRRWVATIELKRDVKSLRLLERNKSILLRAR